MGIATPGIGSGLDVNGIVSKLMAVESQPLSDFDNKTASYQAQLSALGSLSGAVSGFQSSLQSLSTVASFQSISATPSDASVLNATATSKAASGNYNINVTQLAQAQTLTTAGLASSTSAIGLGNSTTLTFQLGAVTGGTFGIAGTALGAGVLAGGISNGSLTINGTAISTDSSIRSAKQLADAINTQIGNTGVSASAATTASSASLFGGAGNGNFGSVDTSGGGTYSLTVGGVTIASQATGVAAGAGVTAASIDTILAGNNGITQALNAANISHTGTAANGDLQFTNSDGDNITIAEAVSGSVDGGIGNTSTTASTGSTVTASSTITLSSSTASPITVGGTNPAIAGLTAGTAGSYLGASFAQDGTQSSGTVVIDSTNNSLQGIRDAINKANIGVTATIVSDGSASPNHLVLSSSKPGANSSIKLSLSGTAQGDSPDSALSDLLSYDPSGTQKLTQNTAAQSTTLTVNGIPVTSTTSTVTGAIDGVTLNVSKTGSTNLGVAANTSATTASVTAFVKAYNDLNSVIANLTSYDPTTQKGGPLLGDATVRTLQTQLRRQLSSNLTGLTGSLTDLSQVGVSFQKDGSLALDTSKLQTAITNNFSDIAGLFAAVGNVSDNLVSFTSSTSATVPGSYGLNITTLATQGTLTSAASLPATTTIADATTWNVTINDTVPATPARTATISLAAGTYTPAALATLIQSAINGVGAFAANGLAVNANVNTDGTLSVASTLYGSTSNIAISSQTGTAVTDVFGDVSAVTGVDVAGTIGGQPALGSGQNLTGAAGTSVEGLKIQVTGGATGDRGTVGFSQGYAYQLNNLAANFLGSGGLITGETDGINASIKDVASQRADFAARLVDIEARYRAQFTALDTSIASLNSTQTFLTQQFAAIAKQTA